MTSTSHPHRHRQARVPAAGASRREVRAAAYTPRHVLRLTVREVGDDLGAADRGTLAAVAATGGLAGLASLAPGLPGWAVALLAGLFALAGPGGLVVAALPAVPRPLAVAAVPALGPALLSLVAAAELAAGQFHARLTTGVIAVVVLVAAVSQARRAGWSPAAPLARVRAGARAARERRATRPVTIASVVATAVALACGAVGIARLPGTAPTDLGPLVRVPELAVAAVLAAAALALALRARSLPAAWAAVGASVVVLRGPTLLSTETALYEWTYRHLGVIDWFVRAGHYVREVDVYNNWPGALALGAWFVDTTGADPLGLAHGFQFGYHLLLVPVVYALGRCAGLDRYGAVAGTGIVEFAGWVGQDYLSPQAFAYLLAALAVAALLATPAERFRTAGVVIGAVAATAVVWSHQLTPVWLIVVAGGLAVLGAVRPRWVVVLLILLWAPSVAVNLDAITSNAATFTFDVLENTRGNVRTVGSAGQRVTSATVKALSAAMWVAALIVAVTAGRDGRGRWAASLAVPAFASFVLLGASYGGEAVFRVFLFSLLGCGPLLGGALAAVLVARGRGGSRARGRGRAVAAGAALAAVAVMGMQGFLGGWYALTFDPRDVETARRVEHTAGPTGAVVPLEYAHPLRSTWVYLPQARDDALAEARWDLHDAYVGTDGADPGPVHEFTRDVAEKAAGRPVYVMVSRPIRDFVDYFGIMRPGGVDRVVGHLLADGWQVVLDEDGTLVLANPVGRAAWR